MRPTWFSAIVAAGALASAVAAPARGQRSQAPAKIDPSWLKVDSAKSTATFAAIAGLNGSNGNMNFNGAVAGGLTLTVPLNWHVVLHFQNNDQVLPHSVEVIPAATPVPVNAPPPAFPRAASSHLQGSGPDSKEDIRFVADKAGSYDIYCAVTGHGAAGMWIHFVVSAAATTASLTAGS